MGEEIEGLPPGVKIVAIKPFSEFKYGEYLLSNRGWINKIDDRFVSHSDTKYLQLVPDNIYGVIDLLAVPIPDGFERVGETAKEWFREPVTVLSGYKEKFVWADESDRQGPRGRDLRRIIICPIKPVKRRVLRAEWEIVDGNADRAGTINTDVADLFVGGRTSSFAVHRPIRASIGESDKPETLVDSFHKYCKDHPQLRFWRALRAWSGAGKILFQLGSDQADDTFNWQNRDRP